MDYFNSLNRLLQLPKLGLLLPAHGDPVKESREKIQEYISHRTQRENAIFNSLHHTKSLEEIVSSVYTDVPESVHPLAALNVKAHLEKLLLEGRITENNARYRSI